MKHIAFYIANFNHRAGTERCVSIIASQLAEEYKVSIISFNEGLNPGFPINENINLYSLEGEKIKRHKTIPIVRRLLKLYKKIKFDCIIVVDICIFLPVYFLKKVTHIKSIAWEHFNCVNQRSKVDEFSRKLAVKYADKVIVLGQHDLNNYKTKFPKLKKIDYIYNPIAFDIDNNFEIKNKKIIAAGRLEYQKGFDLLIKAWEILEQESIDWELEIYGEGSLKDELQKQISSLGLKRISLKGNTENLKNEMNQAGMFVFSSRYEGFGLVLLEAQAQGLPIVSFNCKEGPSEIIDDGVNGFLVESENYEMLAKKMDELMKNDALRLSFSLNSQKDLSRFNLNSIIQKWKTVLNELQI